VAADSVLKRLLWVRDKTPLRYVMHECGLEPLQLDWCCAEIQLHIPLTNWNSFTMRDCTCWQAAEFVVWWLLVILHPFCHGRSGTLRFQRRSCRIVSYWSQLLCRGPKGEEIPVPETFSWCPILECATANDLSSVVCFHCTYPSVMFLHRKCAFLSSQAIFLMFPLFLIRPINYRTANEILRENK